MSGNKPNNKYLFHKFEAANNREGGKATQASRASHLHIVARELSEMGYRHLSPRNLSVSTSMRWSGAGWRPSWPS